ncbi:hypothetical protein BVC80_1331g2 [Macleaya cordata]|uniref:Uncharacterized protein n=1 Tax=Macleaya cordata TaxID=56857 RepID=A0A200QXS9_MACCD|nr:hypothetical protein BVC80_1331g2 [Macleaya cordata]
MKNHHLNHLHADLTGCSDQVKPRVKPYKFSNKRLKDLGLEFISVKQCLNETVKSLQDKGHLSIPPHNAYTRL